jgi:hypothetical protein
MFFKGLTDTHLALKCPPRSAAEQLCRNFDPSCRPALILTIRSLSKSIYSICREEPKLVKRPTPSTQPPRAPRTARIPAGLASRARCSRPTAPTSKPPTAASSMWTWRRESTVLGVDKWSGARATTSWYRPAPRCSRRPAPARRSRSSSCKADRAERPNCKSSPGPPGRALRFLKKSASEKQSLPRPVRSARADSCRNSARRLGIHPFFVYGKGMLKATAAKTHQRSEDGVLDRATQQLLRAAKDEAKKSGKPLNREQLRREGYSERFIDKVENA